MDKISLRQLVNGLLVGLCTIAFTGWAHADPPSRVARLAFSSGSTSFSPGGESDWARATVNRPLITGDRLWVDAASRAELQLGGAAIRLGPYTSVTLLNVDDHIAQLQLAQGSLNLRIRHLDRNQSFEIDTPNLAFSIRRPGSYRINVDSGGESTAVAVHAGEAEVFGEGSAFVVGQGRSYRFWGTGLRDYEAVAMAAPDDFDHWSASRDRRWEESSSARYVSRDLIGYQDLDDYGTWRSVAGYGNVWTPQRVAADWAPYRDGHWAWVEPWGWTWVDNAPWGFAPSHYGRWAYLGSAWAWVPGPMAAVPVYAPALVAFIGGNNFSVSGYGSGPPAIGWFALGPRDVYRPSYASSRGYFTRVNTSNTVVNITNITNIYNNVNVTQTVYVNQQVPGAVVAVPATVFIQSRPIAREAVRITREMIAATPVVATAPAVPMLTSLLGAGLAAGARPPDAVLGRRVLSRETPPPVAVPFAARQAAFAANPGRSPDPISIAPATPAAPTRLPAVQVVTAPAALAPPPRLLPEAPRRDAAAPPVGRPEERDHRVSRDQERAVSQPNRASQPALPLAARAPPALPPAPAPARLEAAQPPEAARVPHPVEVAPRNAARHPVDEERRATPPPAAIRIFEPPRLAMAPPVAHASPPVVHAAPPAAGAVHAPPVLSGAPSPAPAASHGDGGGQRRKGEDRRNGEEGRNR